MRRFYVNIPSDSPTTVALPEEEAKHISKVLRMQLGDSVELVNGKGDLFVGEISIISQKKVEVRITDTKHFPEDNHHIHIAIAPTKHNDRIEWFLEKVTELGVHEISLLSCDNSERKKINLERYKRILVAAMKQSKRLYLPQLNPMMKCEEFIGQHPNGLLAHCYEDQSRNTTIFKALANDDSRWTKANTPILIGPEGDFSLKEVEKALQNQYQTVTLGETRLRTETAGVYACMNVKLYFDEK